MISESHTYLYSFPSFQNIATHTRTNTAHFYIEYAEYRLALENSPTWGKNPDRLSSAKKQLNYAFYANILLGVAVFLGSSILINRLTLEMDRRAADIVTGSSRLFAGWMFMLLSYNLPQWMGVYFSVVDTYKTKLALMHTTREIRFSFSWQLWKHMATMFFFNLYFSCRTYDFTTLYGVLAGIPAGVFLIFVVWATRVCFRNRKRLLYAMAGVSALSLAFVSVVCVAIGAIYIEDTWHEDYARGEYVYGPIDYTTLIFALWIVFVVFVHVIAIFVTRKHAKDETTNVRNRYTSQVFQHALPGVKMDRSKASNGGEGSSNKVDEKDVPKDEQEQPAANDPEDAVKRAAGEEDDMDDDDDDEHFSTVELKTGKTTKDFLIDSSEGPSFCYLFRVKLWETYGCCCCCCPCACRDIREDNNLNDESRMHEIDKLKKHNMAWRAFDGIKMFLWYCISAFFLFLVIVNCGATQQQDVVRANLNGAFEVLYPINYQTGPMCGWSEPNENGEIRSFDSLQELYDADFQLIHCGYCGECSNWNDLSIQWTTRTFLAEVTKKCAQKSLFGDREDVKQCNMDPPVGFTEGCAECWTVDELCAKSNCFWIFLQSTMINAVSDYRVQLHDITSATCDEALCGPEFVPCSGATRRRMNIKSDIERPLYQQCIHQDADWMTIFNHP